jgi:hypothetical protein
MNSNDYAGKRPTYCHYNYPPVRVPKRSLDNLMLREANNYPTDKVGQHGITY